MDAKGQSQRLTPEQRDERLNAALHYYYRTSSSLPLHPKVSNCSVGDDGTVTLRNSVYVLARMLVDESGQVEEMDIDSFDNQKSTDPDLRFFVDENELL